MKYGDAHRTKQRTDQFRDFTRIHDRYNDFGRITRYGSKQLWSIEILVTSFAVINIYVYVERGYEPNERYTNACNYLGKSAATPLALQNELNFSCTATFRDENDLFLNEVSRAFDNTLEACASFSAMNFCTGLLLFQVLHEPRMMKFYAKQSKSYSKVNINLTMVTLLAHAIHMNTEKKAIDCHLTQPSALVISNWMACVRQRRFQSWTLIWGYIPRWH